MIKHLVFKLKLEKMNLMHELDEPEATSSDNLQTLATIKSATYANEFPMRCSENGTKYK